jgi:predicted ATPase
MGFEDAEGRRFLPQELSNGTLRFLALACISARDRQDAQRGAPPPLTLIEEPETGIFVGELKHLFQSIDPSGREGQYIFTSHSPYFVDLFDAHLDGVFVLKREKTHTTLVRPDPERVRHLIEEEFSLGELHFREMLG